MTTAIVGGALANKPGNGGNAWTRLQWLLGLRRLGFRTYFIEQIDAATCTDADGATARVEDSVNLAFFRRVMESFDLADSSALVSADGTPWYGLGYPDLVDLAAEAALLINLGGHLALPPLQSGPRHRVYLDDDPGYTQIWHAAGNPGPRLAGHEHYFTYGANLGAPDCPIPTGDVAWRPTRPPVVLEEWPVSVISTVDAPVRFTTVASWRGPYGPVSWGGRTYGLKVHEFRKLLELPQRSGKTFEIALDIHPADGKDLDLLRSHGWRIVEPRRVAADPAAYRRYLQGSGAELSAAQGIYVETRSGWFSDRTVCYLASGKPALVQDTGLGRRYPVGEGLLLFRTLDEACAGVEKIARDDERHCLAARALAEDFFDSDKVIGALLEEIGVGP